MLVDTYDTLASGVPNAIQVGKELAEKGHELFGIRLDSGDLAYLSREARRMLDEAGFKNAKIVASGDLDEYLVESLKRQGAEINTWGIGTRLVTSYTSPALGGGIQTRGPGRKRQKNGPQNQTFGQHGKNHQPRSEKGWSGCSIRMDECGATCFSWKTSVFPGTRNLRPIIPCFPHISKEYPKTFEIRELMAPVLENGQLVYESPSGPGDPKKRDEQPGPTRQGHPAFRKPPYVPREPESAVD